MQLVKKEDPPVKKNGHCFVCDKPRPGLAIISNDPFCSTNCCRSYYGIELVKVQGQR